jgi:hypothetical protein
MAVRVKPTADVVEKWSRRAAAASSDYTAGVAATPPADWENAATAAEGTWQQALQAAIAAKRYGKGVKGSGAKWQEKSTDLGGQRYAPGVAAGTGDYATNVAPYLQTISSLTLPPRGPTGDPRNIQRVAVIADALRKKKTGER